VFDILRKRGQEEGKVALQKCHLEEQLKGKGTGRNKSLHGLPPTKL